MRTTLLSLLTICLTLGASASHRNSSLIIDTYHQGSFNVEFAGQDYYASGPGTLQIDEVDPGLHWMKVYTERQLPNGGGMYKLLYQGHVRIPPRSMVTANIARHYRISLAIANLPISFADCGYGCALDQCGHSHYGQGHGQPSGYGNEVPVMEEQIHHGHGGCTLPGNTWDLQPRAMSDEVFTRFRRSVQRMSFESDKLDAIAHQLRRTYMTSAQVRTLMSVFCFDSSRLELAQMAYPRVIDEHQFFIVTEAFTFSSTRRAFYESL